MRGNISKQSMKFLSDEFMALLQEYHSIDPVGADEICVEMMEDFKRMDVGDSLSRMEGFNEGVEKGRKIGQEEAWSLARRVLAGDFAPSEYAALKDAFQLGGDVAIEKRVIMKGSYAEVAAKVEELDELYRQRHPEWEGAKQESKSDENDVAVEHELPVSDDPVFKTDADDSVFVKLKFQDNAWLLLKLPDTIESEVNDQNGLVTGEGEADLQGGRPCCLGKSDLLEREEKK